MGDNELSHYSVNLGDLLANSEGYNYVSDHSGKASEMALISKYEERAVTHLFHRLSELFSASLS